jgi:hypothetical protein
MEISKKERLELNALSKEVFGVSTRWSKLVNKGYSELVTEEKEETIPPAKEGDEPTKKTVRVPILTKFGAKQSVTKYHTVESIRETMTGLKKQMAELRAMISQHQTEIKAAQDMARKVEIAVGDATGSANVV